MTKPNTIAVNVELAREIPAIGVDVFAHVEGSSFVSGRAALQKAKEVRDIVLALKDLGIPEDRIELAGVSAEVSSGVITKSSSARYTLKIKLADLELLADSLGILLSAKNASLGRLDWQYDDEEVLHLEMLKDAVSRAEDRIAVACEGLKHRALGVNTMTEKLRDRSEVRMDGMLHQSLGAHSGMLGKEDLGLGIVHSKTLSLEVRVEYAVEPLSAGATESH